MNLKELDSFKLSDAVKFHDELNPALFAGRVLRPEVRSDLLEIAQDFIDHLGINNLSVEDITLSGSNAAYSYTPHSDIDLHILVDMDKLNNDTIYRELFDAKKTVYNDSHDITVGGYDVELYVQDSRQPHVSLGEYSVLNNDWIKVPSKRRANLDQSATRAKYEKLGHLAELAIEARDLDKLENVLDVIKKYRKAGLDEHGEFGPENLAYKALRTQGVIQDLFDLKNELHSETLSVNEASGYIPSYAERNDPRFCRALTVDVHPYTMKQQAKKMGLGNISRAGIPPIARASGKVS